MTNKDKLSVKEVADAVGISQQAVYAKIHSNWHNILQYIEKVNGTTTIRSDALQDVFSLSDEQHPTNKGKSLESANNELVDALKQSIADKDNEIDRLRTELDHLQGQIDSLLAQNSNLSETLKIQTQAHAYQLTTTQPATEHKGFIARLFHRE